jgi:hypothetical protein
MGKVKVSFESAPDRVIRELMTSAKQNPQTAEFAKLLNWEDKERTKATMAKSGAKLSLEIKGNGPTELHFTFSSGFPAFIKYRERDIAALIQELITDMQKRIT